MNKNTRRISKLAAKARRAAKKAGKEPSLVISVPVRGYHNMKEDDVRLGRHLVDREVFSSPRRRRS